MDEARWEDIKEGERAAKGVTSALDGVALALPALMRAQKLQKRAARTGFDWPDPSGSEAKIHEEIAELKAAPSDDLRLEEAGDLLFATVNFVRAHGISAEDALRAANAKFERRFRAMETLAGPEAFAKLPLDAQEELWQQVKKGT
jgi:ATP diphosphatase